MNFRLLVSIGLSVAIASLSSGANAATADALQRAKVAGVLQVATEEQYAPYDFIENGKHIGINVDILAEVGKELGLKVEYTDLPWDSVLPGLQAKKYDVVAGPAGISAERQARFRFLIPISIDTTVILKRKGDKSLAKSADIAGRKIGTQRAASPLQDLKAYASTLSKPPVIVEYVAFTQANADLAAGRIDGVANSSTNTLYTAEKRKDAFEAIVPGFGKPEYSSFVGRKDADSKTLLDAMDTALLKMEKDGRMKAIQIKWYGHELDLPDHVPAP